MAQHFIYHNKLINENYQNNLAKIA